MERLWAPWRLAYVASASGDNAGDCVFCDKAGADDRSFRAKVRIETTDVLDQLFIMGNSNGRQSGAYSPRHHSISSTNHPARTFDGGSLSPHGIYPGQPDYNPAHVLKYIRERRLAPFYKGLDDYESEWTDYQLSYFVKEGKLPPSPMPGRMAPSPWAAPSRPMA
jgi:hypothetical protein